MLFYDRTWLYGKIKHKVAESDRHHRLKCPHFSSGLLGLNIKILKSLNTILEDKQCYLNEDAATTYFSAEEDLCQSQRVNIKAEDQTLLQQSLYNSC